MSNKETAQEIFDTGIENGDSKDTIIISMVQGGVSLNSAQNWYKDMATMAGIATQRIGHKAEALEFIKEEGFDVEDDEVRVKLKTDLAEKYGVALSTANDYIKSYAKAEGIELPTASFGANPEEKAKIFEWICSNPDCTKPEFKEFMTSEMGRGQGSIDEMYRGIELARNLQKAGVEFAAE